MNKIKVNLIVCILLLISGFICVEVEAPQPVQAQYANNFLNSIGMNSAIFRINSVQLPPISVYSVNGTLVKQITESRFTLEQGFYMIKVGTEVVKVIVR